ncbi:MAG: type IV pilus biogenesis protein PilM [Herminiimonas sp.]|nr:type IV pilus biogenesis protein PilM [Herminiimonas sp.]
MWNVTVLTVLLSLAGYYALGDQKRVDVTAASLPRNLALDMATYRDAVVRHFSLPANRSAADASADFSVLALPAWYRPQRSTSGAPLWRNYIDGAGIIYIFTATPLPVSITADIVRLSKNSVMAGDAVTVGGGQQLAAPADMPTSSIAAVGADIQNARDYGVHPAIAIPAAVGIPAGSPVWLANRS